MRGRKAQKRAPAPDSKFGNVLIGKFINTLMHKGKKSVAEGVMYGALEIMSQTTKQDPVHVFDEAIKNVGPTMEVRSKRIGGANYQIPMPVRAERRLALAFRWILEAARAKKGKPMAERLAGELMDAAKREGAAIKKRDTVHKMAEANRAFAHFAK